LLVAQDGRIFHR
jgi:Icc-related predicted phosphoesterase